MVHTSTITICKSNAEHEGKKSWLFIVQETIIHQEHTKSTTRLKISLHFRNKSLFLWYTIV